MLAFMITDDDITYWTGLIDIREEGTFVWTDSMDKPFFEVGIDGSHAIEYLDSIRGRLSDSYSVISQA